jgi:phospholipid transport system substrate-binding protein
MVRVSVRAVAALLASVTVLPIALAGTPALAAAPAGNEAAAADFIKDLADRAYQVLRQNSNDKAAVRAEFRRMLKENFAIEEIGNKLIRRQQGKITKAQYDAYMAAFPDYVVDTYTDNLFEYVDSKLQVIRTVPRGSRGNVDVYTRITRNDGAQPIDAIWSVKKEGGKFLINNLTVAGVNLSLTQEADFNSFIARNGFDALVQFMRDASKKSA